MNNQSTIELMRAMKLNAMANELVHQIEKGTGYQSLGFEERLSLLVDAIPFVVSLSAPILRQS